jgi:hypothetical protein
LENAERNHGLVVVEVESGGISEDAAESVSCNPGKQPVLKILCFQLTAIP